MADYNIEKQYQLYLQRVKLSEEQMHPTQRQEMRRAFFGAAGQMLVMLRDDLSELPEGKAVLVLENMHKEVQAFWEIQN